jgi:hypothetical protein
VQKFYSSLSSCTGTAKKIPTPENSDEEDPEEDGPDEQPPDEENTDPFEDDDDLQLLLDRPTALAAKYKLEVNCCFTPVTSYQLTITVHTGASDHFT